MSPSTKFPVSGSTQHFQVLVNRFIDRGSTGARANRLIITLHGVGTKIRRESVPVPGPSTQLFTLPVLASVHFNAALNQVVVSDHSPARPTCSATVSRSMAKTRMGDLRTDIVIHVQSQPVADIERDLRDSGICMTTSKGYIRS